MMADYNKIEYIVIDVDGTMTDAGIYYDDAGNELKKFCTKDAAGFFTAHAVGMKIIVLTGRECKAVTRRMQEMNVEFIFQNIKDKKTFLLTFLKEHGCPKDSCKEILERADYVSDYCGGSGAVRDIICHVLKERGQWDEAIRQVYKL